MKRLTFIAALAATFAAHASDGVIEINHAKIMANGGYPYTISQPGSYRLTSNLVQPNATTDVIQVVRENVSIDLNGFAITGANVCSLNAAGSAVVCSGSAPVGSSGGFGINFMAAGVVRNGVVRNGGVQGMGNACILGAELVEDVSAESCGYLVGIQAQVVRRVLVQFSAVATGIEAYRAIDSSAIGNSGVGIGGALEVTNVRSEGNVGDGIVVNGAGAVRGNASIRNRGHGIRVNGGLVTGNYVDQNQGAGIYSGDAVMTSIMGNVVLYNGTDAVNSRCGIEFGGSPSVAMTTQNVLGGNGTPHGAFSYAICAALGHSDVPSILPNSNFCNGAGC